VRRKAVSIRLFVVMIIISVLQILVIRRWGVLVLRYPVMISMLVPRIGVIVIQGVYIPLFLIVSINKFNKKLIL
jgi:hypothetical protein